jgi:uncharacterized protein (TIGR02452 family)
MSIDESAAEVISVLEAGGYLVDGHWVDFAHQQRESVDATRLYHPDELLSLQSTRRSLEGITVDDSTTQAKAMELARSGIGRVGLLNFASARNPGGGFLSGAKAQEEDLCRCSGLYSCLLQCPEYYEVNRQQTSLLYTDYSIFSPDVPFFRIGGKDRFLAEPFFVSVITSPAPNSAPYLRNHSGDSVELEATFLRRWKNVLRIAIDQGISRLLLGAWGCGAFGGDPQMASRTAKLAIQSDGGGIEEIVFAIPAKGKQSQVNYECFKAAFAKN